MKQTNQKTTLADIYFTGKMPQDTITGSIKVKRPELQLFSIGSTKQMSIFNSTGERYYDYILNTDWKIKDLEVYY